MKDRAAATSQSPRGRTGQLGARLEIHRHHPRTDPTKGRSGAARRGAHRPGERQAGKSPCDRCEVRDQAFCRVLLTEEFEQLESIRRTREARPREAIFNQGDPASHLFTVTAGTVRIVRLLRDGRRQIAGFLHEGDFLGLTDGGSYTYTAEAITHATLCRFPRTGLETLFERYPALEKCLLGMAVTEIAAAHDQVLLLGRKTARERVATLLIMLSRRWADRGRPESPVDLPMSREDIADYLGLTLETVSRTFNNLRREGYIDFTRRGRATALRVDRLAALTGD